MCFLNNITLRTKLSSVFFFPIANNIPDNCVVEDWVVLLPISQQNSKIS